MDNKKEIIEIIEPLFEEISDLIKNAKQKVHSAINSELALLYWNIGEKIRANILKNQKAEYGKQVVNKLSKKLTFEFGKGYSQASLFRMIRLYDVFPDNPSWNSNQTKKIFLSAIITMMKMLPGG